MQQATRRGQNKRDISKVIVGKQLQWLKLKQLKLGQIQIDGIKRVFLKESFRFASLNHTLNQIVKDVDMLFPNMLVT